MSADRGLRGASDATPILASRAGGAALAGAAVPTPSSAAPSTADETRGLWFGLLGVVIFAMTTPMTRLAVGPASDPQLAPLFVVAGRAALAGLLSVAYLLFTGAPRPLRRHATALWMVAL